MSLKFGGLNADFLTAPNRAVYNIAGDLTLCVWVKRGALGGTTNQVLTCSSNSGFFDWIHYFYKNDNRAYFYSDNLSSNPSSDIAIAETTGWHHLAHVRNGTTHRHYIDGVLHGTASVTGTLGTHGGSIYVGVDPNGGGSGDNEPFTGNLAFVTLHSVALTQPQIIAMMRSRTPGKVVPYRCVASWHLDTPQLTDKSMLANALKLNPGGNVIFSADNPLLVGSWVPNLKFRPAQVPNPGPITTLKTLLATAGSSSTLARLVTWLRAIAATASVARGVEQECDLCTYVVRHRRGSRHPHEDGDAPAHADGHGQCVGHPDEADHLGAHARGLSHVLLNVDTPREQPPHPECCSDNERIAE